VSVENFTPVSTAIGGGLIGLAAVVLWVANGRIAGISGIGGGVSRASADDNSWRIAFVAGLMVVPSLCAAVSVAPRIVAQAGPVPLILAGLLVGYGTRLGGGCTCGHGVRGIARCPDARSLRRLCSWRPRLSPCS
jgi:uncharacterized membrane protein YedE/YeeE